MNAKLKTQIIQYLKWKCQVDSCKLTNVNISKYLDINMREADVIIEELAKEKIVVNALHISCNKCSNDFDVKIGDEIESIKCPNCNEVYYIKDLSNKVFLMVDEDRINNSSNAMKYTLKSNMLIGGKAMESNTNNKVFVVHGHNKILKLELSNWLYEIGLKPIILSEQPNGGVKGILQKIEENSDVLCAVVLMTGDDYGNTKEDIDVDNFDKSMLKLRARQNVILEAGYFIGALKSDRVIILMEEGVENPGDLDGIIYISPDNENWKESIRKEFKRMGISFE